MPTKLQVAVYDRLIIDVVVETLAEADRVFAKWSVARYKKRLPIGGAIITNADSQRVWDVSVGDIIISSRVGKL